MNRDEIAIRSSLLARLQGASSPALSPSPPPPRITGRPVWLSGTMEQRGLREVAGTCLTEIAAVMNQAPENTSTSSLHKHPWARSCVSPQRSPSWGLLPGSWKKCAGGGGRGRSSQHLSLVGGRGRGRGGGGCLACSGLGKGKAFL